MPQTRNPFAAGFAAISIALLFGYYLPTFTWPKFDFNVLQGAVLLGHAVVRPAETLIEAENISLLDLHIVGAVWNYFLFAVMLAFLYAAVIYPRLPGRVSIVNNLLKGLTLGFALFFIYGALIFNKVFELGFFFSNVRTSTLLARYDTPGDTPNAWEWNLAALLFFVFYGMMLGLFYNPPPEEPG